MSSNYFLILKKALRSMWSMKATYFACISVIAIGVFCYVALSSVHERLVTSKEAYYEQYNFADVFVKVVGAPENVTESIEKLEGISEAQGRLSVNARVVTGDTDKIVMLRTYGIDTSLENQINGIYVEGDSLEYSNDILLGKPFMEAHGLAPGDEIELSAYGNRRIFNVKGAASSPEYIYVMPENGSILPDPYSYEIAFIMKETLQNLSGSGATVTDIGIVLENGYTYDDVKYSLGEELADYGISYVLPRKNQPSNMMITLELDQIGNMSSFMSGLFLAVAAAILYIMLRRLVEQERTQIGVLKAFGFSSAGVIGGYLIYGVITGLLGGVLGAGFGVLGSGAMFDLYKLYFNIPITKIDSNFNYFRYFSGGVMVAVLAGTMASILGTRSVLKLKPAESMRPSAPPLIKKSIFNNNSFFEALLTKRGMMSLRYIERNKFKSCLIVFSISLSYILMAFMFSYNYFMDKMMIEQLTKVEVYDLKLSMNTYADKSNAISDINAIKGVKYSEATIEAPFEASYENISKNIVITGISEDSTLLKILDNKGNYFTPPNEGVLLSKITANELKAKAGGVLTLESPYINEEVQIAITGIVDSSLGSGGFMSLESLDKLLGAHSVTNSILLTLEDKDAETGAASGVTTIKEELLNAHAVASINDKEALLGSYEEMTETYAVMIYMILLMSVLIAFAIIYNISGVSLAERKRELATMRVLGYTPKETAEILGFENYFLCTVAIIIGIPLTTYTISAYSVAMQTEMFTMPDVIPALSYVYAAVSSMAAVFLSNLAIKMSVRKFELAEVLKERE